MGWGRRKEMRLNHEVFGQGKGKVRMKLRSMNSEREGDMKHA